MDIYTLKRRTVGRLVLIGATGTQYMLPFGSPDQVRAETRRLMSEMGTGGGYVLGPAKAILPDTPTADIVALLETALEQ